VDHGKKRYGKPYILDDRWSSICPAVVVDMTSSATRDLWRGKHPSFLSVGVEGLWTDLWDPERHPDDIVHSSGEAPTILNVYNQLWAGAVYYGLKSLHSNRRVFNLNRAG